jgi:GxxExxY protein
MLRTNSSLPVEPERTVHDVIGSCLTVHRELGPGLLEAVYSRALEVEFGLRDMTFDREREVPVLYKGRVVNRHRLDFVVANCIVLEVKSVEILTGIHRAQILSYLRASRFSIGLLVNFNSLILKDGLRRFVT